MRAHTQDYLKRQPVTLYFHVICQAAQQYSCLEKCKVALFTLMSIPLGQVNIVDWIFSFLL